MRREFQNYSIMTFYLLDFDKAIDTKDTQYPKQNIAHVRRSIEHFDVLPGDCIEKPRPCC